MSWSPYKELADRLANEGVTGVDRMFLIPLHKPFHWSAMNNHWLLSKNTIQDNIQHILLTLKDLTWLDHQALCIVYPCWPRHDLITGPVPGRYSLNSQRWAALGGLEELEGLEGLEGARTDVFPTVAVEGGKTQNQSESVFVWHQTNLPKLETLWMLMWEMWATYKIIARQSNRKRTWDVETYVKPFTINRGPPTYWDFVQTHSHNSQLIRDHTHTLAMSFSSERKIVRHSDFFLQCYYFIIM